MFFKLTNYNYDRVPRGIRACLQSSNAHPGTIRKHLIDLYLKINTLNFTWKLRESRLVCV